MKKRRRERTSGMSHVSSGLCGLRDMRGSEVLISKPSSMRFESDLREFNLTCSHQRTARPYTQNELHAHGEHRVGVEFHPDDADADVDEVSGEDDRLSSTEMRDGGSLRRRLVHSRR